MLSIQAGLFIYANLCSGSSIDRQRRLLLDLQLPPNIGIFGLAAASFLAVKSLRPS